MSIRLELPDGRRVEIHSTTAILGRDPSCQIPLPDAAGIEPLHARLRQMAGRWLIESQGEWLLQIGEAPPARMGWLKPGDVVTLAADGPKLIFEPTGEAAPAPAKPAEETKAAAAKTNAEETRPEPASKPPLLTPPASRRNNLLMAVGSLAALLLITLMFWPKQPGNLAQQDPGKDPPGKSAPVKATDPPPAKGGVVGLWPTEDPLQPPPAPEDTKKKPVEPEPEPKKKADPPDPAKAEDPPVDPTAERPVELRRISGHSHYVSDLAFLAGDRQLLTASYDKSVRLWSLDDGREVHRFPGHGAAVSALAVSPDGGRAVSGDLNGAIKLWNLETRLEGRAFEPAPSSITSLAFSRDGKQLLSGHLGAVYLWNAGTGKRERTLCERAGFLGAIFGPDDDVLVYSEDGRLERIALADGKVLARRADPGSLGGVALSSDGQDLAVACRDGILRLSTMDAWDSVRELAPKAAVNYTAFSPDGARVASGGQDGAVLLWSTASAKPLFRMEGHTAAVRRLAFSSDGRLIASGSTDGTARVWRVPQSDPAKLLVSTGSTEPESDTTVVKTKPPKREPIEPFALFPRVPDPSESPVEPKVEPARPAAESALAPPDPTAQAATLRRIKELFKEEYSQRKPEGKRALAMRLFEQGSDPVNPADARYVLLREARDLASEAADAETAWQAIDELARSFKVSVPEMKLASLAAAVPQSRTPDEARTLALMTQALMERAVVLDDYDSATQAIPLGVTAARKAQDASLVTQVQSRGEDIREIKREYLKVKPALDALAVGPADGAPLTEASTAAGKFLALYKNDWPRGLKLLSQGSDERLAMLAALDLSEPDESAAQIRLGDGWWELAESVKGLAREQVLRRAGRWYELALASAGGLDKVRLEKRLAQIAPPPEKPAPKLPDRKLPGKE